jgi:D-alanine-D-alanine ligase-like ATP-grasp enzyme
MTEDLPRRVSVLHDRGAARQGEQVSQVASSLRRLGYDVAVFGLADDLDTVAAHVQARRPELVVNLCEELAGNPQLAPDVAAALEHVHVPFTGAGPAGLYLARDPALARRLLLAHGVASGPPVDAPETEVIVGVLGNEPAEAFVPIGVPLADEVAELALRARAALRLRDYGLLAVRVDHRGVARLAGAMPNPPLTSAGELARAARGAGLSYDELIQRVVTEALTRAAAAAVYTSAAGPGRPT